MTIFPTYTSLPFGDREAFAKENQQWCLFTYQPEAVLFGACEFFVCYFFGGGVVHPPFFLPSKNQVTFWSSVKF